MFERLQLGLVAMIAITLLGGAALAGMTIFHILRLEGEAQRRLEESVQAQASLQELSAKLVRAQEEERRKVSRELHDEVGQAFSAVLMESENLLDLEPASEVRPRLESIRGLAEKGMNEIRNMALLLRPSMLDDFGLVPALDWQARETAKRTGMRVEVASEVTGESSRGAQDLHLSRGAGGAEQLRAACPGHRGTGCGAQRNRPDPAERSGRRQRLRYRAHARGWDCWAWRNACAIWEERSKSIPSPGRGTLLQVALPLAAWNGHQRNGTSPHPAG